MFYKNIIKYDLQQSNFRTKKEKNWSNQGHNNDHVLSMEPMNLEKTMRWEIKAFVTTFKSEIRTTVIMEVFHKKIRQIALI